MAKTKSKTAKSRISSTTGSYLGNTRDRSFTGGSGKFMNRNQKYREVRKGFGLSAG